MTQNKNFILILGFIFINCIHVSAQSLRYKYLSVNYLQLPNQPLNKDYKTYSVDVKSANEVLAFFELSKEDIIQQYYELNGFVRLPGKGDFSILLEIDKYELKETQEKTEIVPSIDDSNMKTTYYYLETPYYLPLHLTLFDHVLNRKITEYNSTSVKNISFGRVEKFASREALQQAWETQKMAFIKETIKAQLLLFIQQSSEVIHTKHDFQPKNQQVLIFTVSKKTEDFERFEQAYEETATAFATMQPDQTLDTITTKLQAALSFWEAKSQEYTLDDEQWQKIKQGCLINLATVYYWLDNLEKAEFFNQQAMEIKNTGLEGFATALKNEIKTTKKLMATNQCTTRHFVVKAAVSKK